MDWIRSALAVALGFGIFVIGSFMPRGAAAGATPRWLDLAAAFLMAPAAALAGPR